MPEMESRPARVLVVDDDPANRELVVAMLQAKGYVTIEAQNGADALRFVEDQPPDVILLDVMMPEMDGLEACRRLKSSPASAPIPILLVTALKDRFNRLAGIEAGANDFISKPVDGQDLLLRVRNSAQAKRLYDELALEYEKVRRLESLRDSLTYMIVHDLKNPLTGLQGFLQLLQLRVQGRYEEKDREFVGKASFIARYMEDLISSLLDIGRLEEGRLPLSRSPCSLKGLAEEAITRLGFLSQSFQVSIVSDPEPPLLSCDPDLIRRVIENIAGNAFKHTPKGGSVAITIERLPAQAKVTVTDSGPGVVPEQRERIFDKFGIVSVRSKSGARSTGLGLAFCKLAVEAHGGRIGVDSREGAGCTFWFTLPEVSP